jgi:5-methylcytosine-specific restriction endonuclease McrA
MPVRPCLEPRCPNFAAPKGRGRCLEHYRQRERERNRRRRADPNRGKRVQLYHSKRWLALRKKVLFEQPICAEEGCMRLATEVDHIIPMSRGGAEYERDNCQGLDRCEAFASEVR